MTAAVVQRELRSFLPHESVLVGTPAAYLVDETETRGVKGRADAVVVPGTADEVAEVVRWCYDRGVPIIPRGGGTGFAAGAVPLDGGVVVSLERLTRVRMFDPLLWRIFVEAGLRTAELRRIVRESGLFFPPDPGAAEQSQIGGNIATNAGGPHAFKYGVTGAWVTGLEAVLPPGEFVSVGGAIRKDVAGYDLKGLLVGSEGALGIVTAAWLRLLPTPEASYPVAVFYRSVEAGCEAIEAVLGNGLAVAALEDLDGSTLRAAGPRSPRLSLKARTFSWLPRRMGGKRRPPECGPHCLTHPCRAGAPPSMRPRKPPRSKRSGAGGTVCRSRSALSSEER